MEKGGQGNDIFKKIFLKKIILYYYERGIGCHHRNRSSPKGVVKSLPSDQCQDNASKSWIISCIRADNLRTFRCGRSFNVLMRGSQKYHVHLNGLIHRGKTQPLGPMLSQGPSGGLASSREGASTPSARRYEKSLF
jgi:hypothetical protein